MSRVTNVILSMSCNDNAKEMLEQVNDFFEDLPGFVLVDDEKLPECWYGGTKMLECDLAIGAFNYLDLGALIGWLKKIDWYPGNAVQLMVKGEDDDEFRLIEIRPVKW